MSSHKFKRIFVHIPKFNGVAVERKIRRLLLALTERVAWFFLSMPKLGSKRKKALKSVCTILGPYRNLTTLIGSVLFLHPNCQVLDHAENRVFRDKKINFLLNYTQDTVNKFCQFVFFASKRGMRGHYGGSVTFSHVFDCGNVRKVYKDRYGENLLKDHVKSIVWKGGLRVVNYMREKKTDISDLCEKNTAIRFIMPVRNPIDCAISHYRTGYGKIFFSDFKDYNVEEILEKILLLFQRVLEQKKLYPERFFCFFEHEFNENLLIRLADFLGLNPEERWINDALAVLKINKKYQYPDSLVKSYKKMINLYFIEYPAFFEGLNKFEF